MSEEKRKFNRIAVAWENNDANGKNIKIVFEDGREYRLIPNKYKSTERHPDYVILENAYEEEDNQYRVKEKQVSQQEMEDINDEVPF